MRGSHSSLTITRALAVCLAALLGIGQLFALGHLVLVQHTACAEHGDMHHAESTDADSQPAVEAHVAVVSNSDASVDDHDHCDGWVRVDESCLTISAGVELATLSRQLAASGVLGADAAPPIPLLAIAPKLPPPSV